MSGIISRNRFPEHVDKMLSSIATSGYTAVVNFQRVGSEFFVSTYPKEWLDEYDEKSYMWCDPILISNVIKKGNKRWSDCTIPDLLGMMKSAEKYGLKYGALFSRFSPEIKHPCMLSVARSDRELTDEEMAQLGVWFSQFITTFNYEDTLTIKEKQALELLGNDYSVSGAAIHLNITDSAIKSRLKKCRDKLKVDTNTGAVAKAISRKLI